jgi:putative ABC transport system substrate-binding protein
MRRYQRLVKLGIILLQALVCVIPPAWAAPPAPPMVAIIIPRDNARFQTIHAAFLRNFEKITTVAGKPRLYLQSPSADIMSLRNSIRKATALGADLIVVYGSRAATAAKYEDFTEPLIFADVFDPVAMGLVPSLERGGALMTGVCGHGPLQTLLKALQETLGTIRLGVPVEPKYPAGRLQTEMLRKAACRRDASVSGHGNALSSGQLCWLEVIPVGMQAPGDMISNLETVADKIDAVYLGDLLPTDRHAMALLEFAARAGLPVISQLSGAAEKGALVSLEADPEEQGELLANIAVHMLDGDLPEDVPVIMPRRVSLVINLMVAKQLGIEVPFPVLLQTTRVIR